jgi:hypothetical protein
MNSEAAAGSNAGVYSTYVYIRIHFCLIHIMCLCTMYAQAYKISFSRTPKSTQQLRNPVYNILQTILQR